MVDEERTFVGSMNMDPRSARINTEAGIVIRSAPLARLVAKFLRVRQELASYKVQQQGDRLGWLSRQAAPARTSRRSPAEPAMPVRLLAQLLGEGVPVSGSDRSHRFAVPCLLAATVAVFRH